MGIEVLILALTIGIILLTFATVIITYDAGIKGSPSLWFGGLGLLFLVAGLLGLCRNNSVIEFTCIHTDIYEVIEFQRQELADRPLALKDLDGIAIILGKICGEVE